MLIRTAKQADCKDVFQWRNDLENRLMFLDESEVAFHDHLNWFMNALEDQFCNMYILETNGNKVGICRFVYNDNQGCSEVSINLNPRFKNKGFGKKLLKMAISSYYAKNTVILSATIKNENYASKKIFSDCGFVLINQGKEAILTKKFPDDITFKKVSDDDVDVLYELLSIREHSISHRSLPSYQSHSEFVLSKPYMHWFIIKQNGNAIGTFYLQNDNSIGLNISSPNETILGKILSFISKNFYPQKEEVSKIPPYFYINVSAKNIHLIEILKKMGRIPIQVSFQL